MAAAPTSPQAGTISNQPPMPIAELIGLILARAIVPLWVLTGAIFKLSEKTPKLLPQNIWETAAKWEFDLYWLLAILIAIELIFVGVMFLLPKLARPAGIAIMGIFLLVLIWEIASGHTSCGCLGAFSPSPWIMLAIDGALFMGLIALPTPRKPGPLFPSGPATVFAFWTLAALCITGVLILPEASAPVDGKTPQKIAQNGAPAAPDDAMNGDAPPPTPPVQTVPRPALYIPKLEQWHGRKFSEIELSQWVNGWPENINAGPYYVIFYSRTCDHCRDLLNYFFASPAPAPTVIVAIPENKQGFSTTGLHEHQCAGCLELALPIGTEWMMTAPLVIALQDGVVQCAAEGVDPHVEQPQCLIFH